jgi:hypothetical protein
LENPPNGVYRDGHTRRIPQTVYLRGDAPKSVFTQTTETNLGKSTVGSWRTRIGYTAAERKWPIYDSQGQIVAWPRRTKS